MIRILPEPGPPRVLAVAQFVNSLGDGAFYACSALFFTRIVGLPPAQVGLALTVGWATGMAAGVPLGHLADRWGPRRTSVVLALATAAMIATFLVIRSFPVFVVAICGYACCQAGLTSARQALLAALVAAGERTRVRARLQATLNAGLALGAGLGGLALAADTPAAYLTVFAVDATGFLAAALVLSRLPEPAPGPPAPPGEPRLAVLRDRPYALLTIINAIMYLNMPLLSLGLPLWIVQRTDAPAATAAALLVVNMIAVVLFQVRVARRVTGPHIAAVVTRRAGLVMFAACAVYALSGFSLGLPLTLAVLIVAALIQVFGEMMQGAGGWELSFALAPEGRHGQYQGFYGMAPQLARTLGPLLMTTLLLGWGTPGWLALGGLFATAGLAVIPVIRYAERRAQASASLKPSCVAAKPIRV
ncbi:MFS transporter [Spongiactinospora sp. TRM90649]|uniref:MFS transporter n=1 Tax=Spongiactinospora sp. TRM90649 TaxID=3031114 RepID=UPI0023F9E194|nr:MFS transporter [Spongiactinospora sp. TRM90649]MDF5757200.1 MFS transporter [Spongiactinospora sp. TRM90649]